MTSEEKYVDELEKAISLMGEYKEQLARCKMTMEVILESPDRTTLYAIRPFLQTRISQINQLGI